MTAPAPSGFAAYNSQQSAGGTTVGTQPAQIYVPSEYSANQDLNVPGLSSGYSTQAAHALQEPGAAGTSQTFASGLAGLLQLGQEDEQGLSSLQEQLIKAGYLNPDDSTLVPGSVSSGDATYDAYAKLLNDAVTKGEDYSQILQDRINDPKNTTGQKFWQEFEQKTGAAPTTKTETSTDTNLTDAPDARAIAANEFQSLLGRNVNDKEAAAFQGALNAYEQANPTSTTATTTYDPTIGDQPEVRNETSSGGINAAGAAQLADSDIIENHGKAYAKSQGNQIYDLFAQLAGGQ